MRYCPYCEGDYDDNLMVCPYCSASRRESLSSPPAAPEPAPADSGSGDSYMHMIQDFLELFSNDAQAKAKTAKQQVIFQITLSDTEESFFMCFNKGRIETGLGCRAEAEVNLRMPVEIFDGLMMGTVKGPNAVMNGQMSFTGNVRKAMGMQVILNLMMTSYQAAAARYKK